MNPAIFRPNDIRGIVDQDFDVSDFTLIGQAYAKYLLDRGTNRSVVGRDNRLHSVKLEAAFVKGLTSSGVDVILLGQVTTPMMYFSRGYLGVDGGAVVTASHNPASWNGLKLCQGGGAIHESEIEEVRANVLLKKFVQGEGKTLEKDVIPAYLEMIAAKADFKRVGSHLPVKTVAVDSGNGLAGLFVPGLLRKLGLEVIELNSEPDGTFPNHLPDPSIGENMKDLWHLKRDQKIDLGLAYDGDVDRLNVIDESGTILWGDGLTTFFAREVLERLPGSEILYDVMSSPGVPEDIAQHGGIGLMVPPGHALIAHRLHRLGAPMAGEYSGHHYFQDGYFGFDDAIYASMRLLKILSDKKTSLTKLMSDLPFYYSSGVTNIPISEDKKARVITKLQDILSDRYYLDKTSGARLKVGETWASIHPSGTEAMLRLVVWGKDETAVDKTRKILLQEIDRVS